jgi:hypothetical protein
MTTTSKVIGVVILSVAAAIIWHVKPRVALRLEPKEILTVAVEETKENKIKTYIIHKTFLPLWIDLPPYLLIPRWFYSGLVM